MKNQQDKQDSNGVAETQPANNRDFSKERSKAFAQAQNNNEPVDQEITPEVVQVGGKTAEAPHGIDTQKPPSKNKLLLVIGMLVAILIVFGAYIVFSVLNNNKKDAIDVGSAEKKETRDQQYRQVDETIKGAFANSNSINANVQPTPPATSAGNANLVTNPSPYPNSDWDKMPSLNPNPTGNVGDDLNKAANANTASNSNGKLGGERSGNASGGNSGGGSSSRQDFVSNRNPQVLEVSNTEGRRIPSYSGAGARNQQTSIYYYARSANGAPTLNKLEPAPNYVIAQKPRFNDVFPIRLLGSLHSLRSGGLARMILTRPVEGAGYFLPKGTFFIGRVSGGEGNRLFIALVGYIDPQTQGLVSLGGDVNGVDGGLGIKGERKRLDNRLKKFFGEAWRTSRELGIAYLLGRRGGGGGYGGFDSRVQSLSNYNDNQTKEFIVVQSGQEGYIVVNDLPPAIEKPVLPETEKDFMPADSKMPVDASSISENDLNTLSGFGEEQIKELMALPPDQRERRLQTYSPQLQAILREALK